jgi:polysaccharide biosynthesis protein PslA
MQSQGYASDVSVPTRPPTEAIHPPPFQTTNHFVALRKIDTRASAPFHMVAAGWLIMADIVACVAALLFARILFQSDTGMFRFAGFIVAVALAQAAATGLAGGYGRNGTAPGLPGLAVTLPAWPASLAATLLLAWVLGGPNPLPTAGSAAAALVFGLGFLTVLRLAAGRRLRAAQASGRHATRVALVGAPAAVDRMAERLSGAVRSGAVIVADMIRVPDLGNNMDAVAAELETTLPGLDVTSIIVCLPRDEYRHLAPIADAMRGFPSDVLTDPSILPATPDAVVSIGGLRLVALSRRPLRDWHGIAKRAEDLALGFVLTFVMLPVMALIAVAIRASSRGPVMIRQRRFGYANQPIMVLKFRTMYWESGDLTGARATVPGDPRVTRLGRFLRATSLDELPQLFNVLAGSMSLVGPRPHPVEMRVNGVHYHKAVRHYAARHRMKPGITGLAQINGYRGLVDTMEKAEGRLAFDLQYVETWSVAADLDILARTVSKGFISDSAF